MFIEKTLQFLEESDLEFAWPDIRHVHVDSDGRKSINHSFHCNLSSNRINNNRFLSQITIFSLCDALIDVAQPELEGQSFKRRYEELPASTSRECIFKDIYRVLKLIRNAIIHNRSALHVGQNGVNLSFTNRKGTLFSLRCSSRAIVLINTIVILYVKSRHQSCEYSNQFIYAYFNQLLSEISEFKDEFTQSLQPITCSIGINTSVRNRIMDAKFSVNDDEKIYVFDLHRPHSQEPWAGEEYLINIDGIDYIIPGEIMGDDGKVHKEALIKWQKPRDSLFA
ncbi:hypothetical protein OE749_14795 [Aestuariibacter sp. AA17]|uniref:Abi-like protein n=1 Tax=Fluctibacter corallii TaxID=2984329 RepID=A0ABT3ABG0_9ALTE|nr:hypothetical protein [Aestuariibacter sp. AA17]MCV2885958.1 hypothetical protein [Aestuariibacter sp. AA17]